MRNTRTALASAGMVALTIVSTTFVFLALAAPNWTSQAYFFAVNGQSDGTDQKNAVCTATRSPFYRCGIPQVFSNGSCTIPSCTFYRPYGVGATSCRSAAEMGIPANDNRGANGLLGGAAECQQVHYAGNLQIAASVFITLGLLLTLATALLSVKGARGRSQPASQDDTGESYSHREHADYLSPLVPALRLCLFTGVLLQVFAQCFGVLGLSVNATPAAGDVASEQTELGQNNFAAQAWVLDTALAAYATVAWTSALAAAVLSKAVFQRLTTWKRV